MAPLTIPQLVLLVISVGFAEEILFRGLVQEAWSSTSSPACRPTAPPWLALLLAAIVFGLCHAITPAYALFAMVMGLYLGALWAFVPPRNLLVPIVTHALYDFVAILYLCVRANAHHDDDAGEARASVW
ncbi:MAG: CPBP family intramembrane metalloprotease [Gammaproteobacteria bacterium]|nr:CPBP family intramembrane metalloprotease [Gammaproteobacteria bacterium]